MRKYSYPIILLVLLGCTYEFPEQTPPAREFGEISELAVIGGSWASGFMDGALYTDGQNNSFPNLIAGQLALVSTNDITYAQPSITTDEGLNAFEGPGVGKYFIEYLIPASQLYFKNTDPGETIIPAFGDGQVTNLSYPSFKLADFNTDPSNIYADRFSGGNTLSDQLDALTPSTLLIQPGFADLLNYAASGLTGQPNPGTSVDATDLTPIADFENDLTTLLAEVSATSDHIFLLNFPDFIEFPYFNRLGYLAPNVSIGRASALNAQYAVFNSLVAQYNNEQGANIISRIFFDGEAPSSWGYVVEDTLQVERRLNDGTLIPPLKKLDEGESILWSNSTIPSLDEAAQDGLEIPLTKDQFVTLADIATIKSLTNSYNAVINSAANQFTNVHLIDLHTAFDFEGAGNIMIDGVIFDFTMERTGIFSADGLNLNPRGQAIIANLFIQKMNEIFQSSIPEVNPNEYRGNEYRNGF